MAFDGVLTPGQLCPPPWRASAEKGRSYRQHPSRVARRRAVRGGDSEAGAAPRSAGEPAYPM